MMTEKFFEGLYRTRIKQMKKDSYRARVASTDELDSQFINWFAKKYFLEQAYPFNTMDKVKHQIKKIEFKKLITS